MKFLFLSGVLLLSAFISQAQFTYKIKADSVLITNDSCNAELNLENSTKNVLGFLYNRGRGRTDFRKVMEKIDDSTYIIGGDSLLIKKSILSSVTLSAITAASSSNSIDNGNYAQTWQWNSLSGTNGLNISSNSTAAAAGAQKLFTVSLSGANANTGQNTYAAYISNTHSSGSELYTTNYGLYCNASGDIFSNIAGYFTVSGNYSTGKNFGIYSHATNAGTDKTNSIAGYFANNGGNTVLRIDQENSSYMAGIAFVGAAQTWGVGLSASTGNFLFNNSVSYTGANVLQLFAANRVRVGGGSDDGSNKLQVQGPAMFANTSGVPGLTINGGNPTYLTSGYALNLQSGTGPLLTFTGNAILFNTNDGNANATFSIAGDGENNLFSALSASRTAGFNVTSPTRTLEVHTKYHNVSANTMFYVQKLVARGFGSYGTVTAGFGAGQEYAIENSAGSYVVNGTTEFVSTDVTSGSEDADFVVKAISGSTLAEKFRITSGGKPVFQATNTAGGTTGNQTINKTSGTVNIAASGTSITVTNNLVSTSSIVFAVIRTNDSTAQIKNVVPASGSFTINLSAAATAETSVGFLVVN